jgi:D-arabinose 1-dehydrogenase-like Zn-dependent alcohol dehydrogenase
MTLEASRLTINPETKQLLTSTFELPELGAEEVRIQVLFSGISRNDILILEGKLTNDFFGTASVGRVVAIGKDVGNRKVGEVVGVYHQSVNRGEYSTGFSTFLQVNISQVVYVPNTIPLEQASTLLAEGVVAYNSLEKLNKGSSIAVVGTGNLAYLTAQFAKKVFGFHVTVLTLGSTEGVTESFGADAADVLTIASLKKYTQKFDAAVIAEPIEAALFKDFQDIVIRTGKIVISVQLGYSPAINFFELIIGNFLLIQDKENSSVQREEKSPNL